MDTPSPHVAKSVPPQTRSNDLEALKRTEQAGANVMAARNAARKGERERAYDLIRQAFALNPGDIAAIELLGDLYLEDGETEKALALYERALKAHPGHTEFEEKLAVCRLDLAEIEADKLMKQMPPSLEPTLKFEERTPHKAVSLSVFLPGAGQFYNDESEKGAAFLAVGVLSGLGWFYPLWTAPSGLSGWQRLDLGASLASLSGVWLPIFWLCLVIWVCTYLASAIDAGLSASRFNRELRRARGLES